MTFLRGQLLVPVLVDYEAEMAARDIVLDRDQKDPCPAQRDVMASAWCGDRLDHAGPVLAAGRGDDHEPVGNRPREGPAALQVGFLGR